MQDDIEPSCCLVEFEDSRSLRNRAGAAQEQDQEVMVLLSIGSQDPAFSFECCRYTSSCYNIVTFKFDLIIKFISLEIQLIKMLNPERSHQKMPSNCQKPAGRQAKEKKSNPKLRLPFTTQKPKEETQERLTDRTERMNKRIDLGGTSSPRSCLRSKHCEDIIEAHSQSITFYMEELKRREQNFVRKKQQLENDHTERVSYLQRLLKSEINKNMKLQQQLRKLKQKGKSSASQHPILRRPVHDLSNQEVKQLFSGLKKELQNRYHYDVSISRIKDVKTGANDMLLSFSKTDQSLLLGDVARHF